jgi:demethylmenaquinone methyltransferase/2-methoxy-6-polyprenyl-1,4-benzoquinol methylase
VTLATREADPRLARAAGRPGDDPRDGGPRMFNSIARRYDVLNRLLSMRLDVGWRNRAIAALDPQPGQVILDLCTGTGDFGLAALAGHDIRVIGLDVARDMVALGREKVRRRGLESRFRFGVADAEALPLADRSIDGALIAFGIRNVVNRGRALAELARVLRPGGRLVILEFGVPPNAAFRGLYFFYFRHILPVIGGLLSGNRAAYTYLPESVRRFPAPEEFCALARDAGFSGAGWSRLSGGIVTLYRMVA